MEHFLGLTGLLVVLCVTMLLAFRHSSLAPVLLVAFLARASAALFHFYVAPLPDGQADAIKFERIAWELAGGDDFEKLQTLLSSYAYSWFLSYVYIVTGRSPLLAQSLSVLAGVLSVYFTWLIARTLWNERAGVKAAWIMALFPTVVMYSALTMREAFMALCLLIGLHFALRWRYSGRVRSAVAALTAFGLGIFFHGGMLVAAVVFAAVVAFSEGRRWLGAMLVGRARLLSAVALMAVLAGGASFIGSGVQVPKLGDAAEAVSVERWIQFMESRTDETASYPDWTVPSSELDLIWAIPVRVLYFLFSPFPWDLSTASHLMGAADAVLYLGLSVLLLRNWRAIWADPGARMVLLILLPLVLAFAVGTGNFGTGLRHRAKLAAVLVVLAAPLVPRLVIRGDPADALRQGAHGNS